jgi:hypothetical protein
MIFGMDELTVLYRPVGKEELELIRASGFKRFPPRLPHQPIFYPVLNEGYARAEKWNTRDEQSGYRGYVTKFYVRTHYLAQFPVKQVGDGLHSEYWIPAEELENFNNHLVGQIDVTDEFSGPLSLDKSGS